jgi:hypothetical protein
MQRKSIFILLFSVACAPQSIDLSPLSLEIPAEQEEESTATTLQNLDLENPFVTDDNNDNTTTETPTTACHNYAAPQLSGHIDDPNLEEISGIAASQQNPGILWIMEDHGAANDIWAVNPAGQTVGHIVLDGVQNNDWEDIALGNCGTQTCIFIGDTGDNDHDRPWHGILRFPEPILNTNTNDIHIQPEVFAYTYPDGHYDVEALAIQNDGMPVLFTKDYESSLSTAYSFDALNADETATLHRQDTFPTGSPQEGWLAATTAADLRPDGSQLILRTYGHIWQIDIGENGLDDLETTTRMELETGPEAQGEAIAYDPTSRGYWTVSEGVQPALYFSACED